MLIGNPLTFAIESSIHEAYAEHPGLAWGCFTFHIGGLRYGVPEPDATMMACSLGEVTDRLEARGTHGAGRLAGIEAGVVWDAYRDMFYGLDERTLYAGIESGEFQRLVSGNSLVMAPDGDEAFDDGTHVLQFDVGREVRLIAARSGDGLAHEPASLRDVRLPDAEFYGVLSEWRRAHMEAWASAPKSPRSGCT